MEQQKIEEKIAKLEAIINTQQNMISELHNAVVKLQEDVASKIVNDTGIFISGLPQRDTSYIAKELNKLKNPSESN